MGSAHPLPDLERPDLLGVLQVLLVCLLRLFLQRLHVRLRLGLLHLCGVGVLAHLPQLCRPARQQRSSHLLLCSRGVFLQRSCGSGGALRTLRDRLCVLLAALVHGLCRRVVFEPDLAVVAPAPPMYVTVCTSAYTKGVTCAESWCAPVHWLRLPFLHDAH